MPQMSGDELLARLRERRPGLRGLFLTAHTEHSAIDAQLVEPTARLLRKPCRPGALLAAIRDCLDAGSSRASHEVAEP